MIGEIWYGYAVAPVLGILILVIACWCYKSDEFRVPSLWYFVINYAGLLYAVFIYFAHSDETWKEACPHSYWAFQLVSWITIIALAVAVVLQIVLWILICAGVIPSPEET